MAKDVRYLYRGLNKRAEALGDLARSAVPDFVGTAVTGLPVEHLGQAAAILNGKPVSDEELKGYNDSPNASWIPGVGSYRETRRRMRLNSPKGKKLDKKTLAESLGPLTSTLIFSGLGSALGGVMSKDTAAGIKAGAASGIQISGAAHLLASILAAATPTRTDAQQKEYMNSSTWQDWVLPGHAWYNRWKTFGKVRANENKARKIREQGTQQ